MGVSVTEIIRATPFVNIGKGQSFEYHGAYYMRVGGKQTIHNAVNLQTGHLFSFSSNTTVTPEDLMVIRKGE